MTFPELILGLVTLQRVGELVLSRSNTRKLLADGAAEVAPGHYPLIVAVHAAWLLSLWMFGRDQPVNVVALAGYLVLQCFRFWVIRTLGSRWTTRIIVLPERPLVSTGPYRFLSHPNYAVVAGEIALLPLVLGLPLLAVIFTILNAMVLAIRIRVENRALTAPHGYRRWRMKSEWVAEPSIATWLGFVLMCLGMFMAILDIQVVATSLPTIQSTLAMSRDAMSWIQTAYLIAEIIAIPLTGWLTRTLTLRWLFAMAITLFTVASIACAFSGSFETLVCFRVLQGFAGGALIPAVFSAVFLLFPIRLHPVATTMAGIMAVLAPTVGPVVGGWITETWSWHWLFLINVAPGTIAALATPMLLPRERSRYSGLATLDVMSLILLAVSLATLEVGLKEGPQRGWLSPFCSILIVVSAAAATCFAVRTLKAAYPLVELSTFGSRSFAIGCALSFCLGIGLFGSVYLMPVFLAYVRHHGAFEIGTIMLVTGVSQLVTAPIAGALESKVDPRWLSAAGFGLFAIGLGCSAFESRVADFDEMFWPQVLRGVAIMFCLLPPTRLALGSLTASQVPDASGLFNLMRNLGGAIGIALIDTILYGRTVAHADALRDRLIAGDATAAQAIGLDLTLFNHRPPGVSDATIEAYLRPMVEKAAFALSVNEAWALLACVALLGLLLIPFAAGRSESRDATTDQAATRASGGMASSWRVSPGGTSRTMRPR